VPCLPKTTKNKPAKNKKRQKEKKTPMKRLDSKTLLPFLESAGIGVVFFGAYDGKPSLDMAEEFAQLWADVVTSDLVGVRFGYIDGEAEPAAHIFLEVAELPTVLIIRNGVVTHRFEGKTKRQTILKALKSRDIYRRFDDAPSRWHIGERILAPAQPARVEEAFREAA
jgi:hypothetical protein